MWYTTERKYIDNVESEDEAADKAQAYMEGNDISDVTILGVCRFDAPIPKTYQVVVENELYGTGYRETMINRYTVQAGDEESAKRKAILDSKFAAHQRLAVLKKENPCLCGDMVVRSTVATIYE
jgi:hypothetical protein